MPAIKKAIANKENYGNSAIGNNVKDRSNNPFVVKKATEARAFLNKNGLNGLPDQLNK